MGMIFFPIQELEGYAAPPAVQQPSNDMADFLVAFIILPVFVVLGIFGAKWYMDRPKRLKKIEYEPREPKEPETKPQAKPNSPPAKGGLKWP